MEWYAGEIAAGTSSCPPKRASRNIPLTPLRFQLLYLFLHHGLLGLGTLGERNRLDGSTWYQSPFGSRRPGMYLVQYASKTGIF